jgi:tetratricopeptide (TPR) repeat protein
MSTTLLREPETVLAPPALGPVRELYLRGLCLQAYHAAESLGPIREWTGPDARVLAGRLVVHLGAPRLGAWMHLRAYRESPTHPEAAYYHARVLLDRRGPLAAWRFLRRRGEELTGASDVVQADWLALHACVLGRLRDFDAAEQWLDRAEAQAPANPWLCLERSALLELEDRFEESLQAARRSLELLPWYRPGVQCVAHSLQQLGRDDEALDLLEEGAERLETSLLLFQLAALQTELGHHADARATYARLEELCLLLEKDGAQWLAARRSDAAYACEDRAEAAEFARRVEGPLYARFTQELTREPFQGRRVLLDVGFVRQHRSTCVPATLTAISRYWKKPAEHLEVAGAICYDGTPDHRERAWAEENGYVTREFTVTWEAACALLDRGVPFTLTTIEPDMAHLQAVIGYDTCRASLLVRDPSLRIYTEYYAEGLLERHRPTGPRGHALVPVAESHRLDGLDLPDAELYDYVYRLQRALAGHDRASAGAEYEALRDAAPEHRLTYQAARLLAVADADTTAMLASINGLLKLYPDAPLHVLGRWSCLRDLGQRDDRIALLEAARTREKGCPAFRRLLAHELVPDARQHQRAIRLLRSAIRWQPYDHGNLATLAQLLWAQRRFEEAFELYGFAACLDDKNESLARDYFAASRWLQRTEETLRFLRRRFERFGTRSSQPARTLYWALEAFERTHEALALLDEALALRSDGDLLLFAAQCRAENGDGERAEELLASAEGRCPRAAWLRARANIAVLRGDRGRALDLWRQVAESEPMALDANRAVAQHLAEAEGLPAALDFLRAACERFPHHFALHQLLAEWLRQEGAAAQEPIVRRIVAIDPADAWARRELAIVLLEQGRFDESETELDEARRREPNSPSYWCVFGGLRDRQGRRAEAAEAYRNAIRLSVDNDWAIGRLMDHADTRAERRDALALIESELVRQVIFGDGLIAYQAHARHTLDPEELLASLRRAHAARPDLWHAWSALVWQLIRMGRSEEAQQLSLQATARFPLLPRLWIDLAEAHQAREDREGEIQALEKAVQIRPGWAVPVRRLADAYRRAGRDAESLSLCERGVALAPRDAVSHGYLADALWQTGEKEQAFDRIRLALLLDPGYEWGWGKLQEWAAALDRRADAEAFARDLTVRRPTEARSWLKLAETLTRDEDRDERLRALEEVLRLNPFLPEAYDLQAVLLWQAGRLDEAEAACCSPVWNGPPPITLRGRLAWLKAQRGDVPAALPLMRSALAEDPDYLWGWSRQVEWLRDHGPAAEYLAGSEQLVRLAPEQALSYGYRGEARYRSNDNPGAKEDLRKALAIQPQYEFAVSLLFHLQLEDGELKDAARTVALARQAGETDDVVVMQVRLAARRRKKTPALRGLRRLVAGRDNAWLINTSVGAITAAGWAAEARAILDEALNDSAPSRGVAKQWILLSPSLSGKAFDKRLRELLERGEVGREALEAAVDSLGRRGAKARLKRCLRTFDTELRGDAVLWGVAGFALLHGCRDHAAAREWLSDWRTREGVRPWILFNAALANRVGGFDAEATAASRQAVALGGEDVRYHRVWLAFDEALAGNTAAAQTMLEGVAQAPVDLTHQFVRALAQALVAVQSAAPADRATAWAEARESLGKAAKACSGADHPRVLRRVSRAAMARLAEDVGSRAARWWGLWRWLSPLLPAVKAR